MKNECSEMFYEFFCQLKIYDAQWIKLFFSKSWHSGTHNLLWWLSSSAQKTVYPCTEKKGGDALLISQPPIYVDIDTLTTTIRHCNDMSQKRFHMGRAVWHHLAWPLKNGYKFWLWQSNLWIGNTENLAILCSARGRQDKEEHHRWRS
jgi:hypothetical protein